MFNTISNTDESDSQARIYDLRVYRDARKQNETETKDARLRNAQVVTLM